MKRLQRIVLLTHADELDGLPRHLPDGKRRAAAGIAVHLGEDDAGERKLFVELIGGAHCVLPGHSVGDEQNLRWIQQLFQRLHLVHQVVVDVQTAGGVDDQHVAAGNDSLPARFFHQALHRLGELRGGVRLAHFAFVDLRLYRLRHNFQLLARRRTVHVHRNQQRTVPAGLEPVCQLARSGGLAGTLQSGHQHHRGRLRSELHARRVFAESLDQFIAHDLDDLLAGRKRGQHFLPHGFGLDAVDQLFHHFEVDVGLKQRQPDFAQRLGNVFLAKPGLAAKGLKRALQFFL